DAKRVAEEDRTDSEIDRHVDEVLGEPAPGGSPHAPSGGSNGESADASVDVVTGAPDSAGGPPTAPLGAPAPPPRGARPDPGADGRAAAQRDRDRRRRVPAGRGVCRR